MFPRTKSQMKWKQGQPAMDSVTQSSLFSEGRSCAQWLLCSSKCQILPVASELFSLPLKEEHLFASGEVEEVRGSEPSEDAAGLVGR